MRASFFCLWALELYPFPLLLPAHCFMLFLFFVLAVHTWGESNDNKNRQESSKLYGCTKTCHLTWTESSKNINLSFINTWRIIHYLSLNRVSNFWFMDSFSWMLSRGKSAMECFCDLHRSIALPQYHHAVLSQGCLITISQDRGSLNRLIVMCILCDFAICDLRPCVSATCDLWFATNETINCCDTTYLHRNIWRCDANRRSHSSQAFLGMICEPNIRRAPYGKLMIVRLCIQRWLCFVFRRVKS